MPVSARSVLRWLALLPWVMAGSVLAGPPLPSLRLVSDLALPRPHWATPGGVQPSLRSATPAYGKSFLNWSADIRWDDDGHVLVAGIRDGTFRVPVAPSDRTPLERVYPPLPQAGALASQVYLGASSQYLVTAAPAHMVSWISRAPSALRPIVTDNGFDSINDIDVLGDRVLVLGLRRDSKGTIAADGAVAWTARLGEKLTDLRTVQVSSSGPGARGMDWCTDMQMGKVRFLADGSFVVVPGAEPGVFVRDASGKLTRTVPAELVGFDAGCPLSEQEMLRLSVDVRGRYRWLNQQRALDEVLALPGGGIGFLIRSRSQEKTAWSLTVLSPAGRMTTYQVPVTSPSEYARLAGDARGNRIAFLLDLDLPDRPTTGSGQVIVVELPGASRAKP